MDREWTAAQFRVEEFRVPLLRASVQLPAGPLVAPSEVPGRRHRPVPRGRRRERAAGHDSEPHHGLDRRAAAVIEGFTVANGAVATGITRQEQGAELGRGR
jgi:hypothetical protein